MLNIKVVQSSLNFAQFSNMKNMQVAKFEGFKSENKKEVVFPEVLFSFLLSVWPKYLVQIDKGGLPFRIFRGVHGVVQSLMLSNGQKRNLLPTYLPLDRGDGV